MFGGELCTRGDHRFFYRDGVGGLFFQHFAKHGILAVDADEYALVQRSFATGVLAAEVAHGDTCTVADPTHQHIHDISARAVARIDAKQTFPLRGINSSRRWCGTGLH